MQQNIWRNLTRRVTKSLLTVGISAVFTAFLFFYAGSIYKNQMQLEEFSKALLVTAQITNETGSQAVGLKIDSNLIKKAEKTDMVEPILYTAFSSYRMGASLDEETDFLKGLSLSAANSSSVISKDPRKDIQFSEGYSFETLMKNSNENICLMNELTMEKEGLTLGKDYLVTLYDLQYDPNGMLSFKRMGEVEFKLVGSFSQTGNYENKTDMFCSLDLLMKLYEENDTSFYYDSVQFSMTNPLLLNEWKQDMRGIGFKKLNVQGDVMARTGASMIVHDGVFINAATPLLRNMSLMQKFYPIIFFIVAFVGFLISYLLIQSRRCEIAISRSLGMSRGKLFMLLVLENMFLCIIGIIVGLVATFPFVIVDLTLMAVSLCGYFLCYLLGCTVAVSILNRVNVVGILTAAE